ncbi:unnamed protein product, partial [Ectocarpus fasciculatus]
SAAAIKARGSCSSPLRLGGRRWSGPDAPRFGVVVATPVVAAAAAPRGGVVGGRGLFHRWCGSDQAVLDGARCSFNRGRHDTGASQSSSYGSDGGSTSGGRGCDCRRRRRRGSAGRNFRGIFLRYTTIIASSSIVGRERQDRYRVLEDASTLLPLRVWLSVAFRGAYRRRALRSLRGSRRRRSNRVRRIARARRVLVGRAAALPGRALQQAVVALVRGRQRLRAPL